MRVTLSPIVRTFGADAGRTASQAPDGDRRDDLSVPAAAPLSAFNPLSASLSLIPVHDDGAPAAAYGEFAPAESGSGAAASDSSLAGLPGDLAEALLTPPGVETRDIGGEMLEPALQAWLAPLCETSAAALSVDPFGALAPAPGSVAPKMFVDLDEMAGLARASLSATPPLRPSASGGLFMAIEVAGADISDPYADGRAHLRFDPKFDNCDPVYIAMDRAQALALAHRILAWAEDGVGGDAPGISDALF